MNISIWGNGPCVVSAAFSPGVVAVAIFLSPAPSQTIWTGPQTGEWTEGSNWSTGSSPGAGEDVEIDGGNGDQNTEVLLDASRSIATLKVSEGDNLVFQRGRNLTLTGNTIENDGDILIFTPANSTNLFVNGPDTVLSGSGILRLLGDNARILGSGSLLNQSMIYGFGSLGMNGLAFHNDATGLVDASEAAGFPLVVDPPLGDGLRNEGMMQASRGGVLALSGAGGGVFNNAGGTIRALMSSRVELVSGATIEGGTLRSADDGVIAITDGVFSGLANLGNVKIENGRSLRLLGEIANQGEIWVAADANATKLDPRGGVTLSGGGAVRMSGSNARLSGNDAITNANHTIHGEGDLGLNSIGLVNGVGGVVDADVNGAVLQIDPSLTDGAVNTGTLQASGGGNLTLSGAGGGGFDNMNGVIRALADSRVELSGNASIEGGTLATKDSGVIAISGGSFSALTNSGNVVIENGRTLKLFGEIVNEGEILVAADVNATSLDPRGPVTLTGGGELRLSGSNARVLGAGIVTNTNHRVLGQGMFGNNGSGLVNAADGVVDADVDSEVLRIDPSLGEGVVNAGIFQASGGGILALTGAGGGDFDNRGGTILARDGSVVQLGGRAVIQGGVLNSEGSGKVGTPAGSEATIRDLEVAGRVLVENGSRLRLSGRIATEGRLDVESGPNATTVEVSDRVTLSGSGAIVFGGSGRGRLSGGGTLTITDGTIRGHGNLGLNTANLIVQPGGRILADSPEGTLTVDPAATETALTSAGTLQAEGGGTLALRGDGGGGFDNSNGMIRALDASEVHLAAGASVLGGTLATEGSGRIMVSENHQSSLQDVSNLGALVVGNSGTLRLFARFANKGTVTVASDTNSTAISVEGAVVLSGGGSWTLAGNHARILGNGQLTHRDHAIRGSGNFGNNGIGILNEASGLIHADVPERTLSLDPSFDGHLINNGTLRASAGGTLLMNPNGGGTFTIGDQGVVEALAGGTVASGSANLTNVANGTLTGGLWRAVSSGAPSLINLPGDGIHTNAAAIELDGDDAAISGLGALQNNNGPLTVTNGHQFATTESLTNRSAINAGPGGVVASDGDFTQEGEGGLAIAIEGRPPDLARWGRVVAAGRANLSGSLEITFRGGTSFAMVPGDRWKIVQSAADGGVTRSGVFTSANLIAGPHRPANSRLAIGYLDDGVELRFERNPGYNEWARGFGLDPDGDGAPDRDPEGDQVSNLIEYALGMNPIRNDVERLPRYGTTDEGGQESLTLTFQRPGEGYTPADLDYFVERSMTLTEWTAEGVELSTGPTDPLTGLQEVRWRHPAPIATTAEGYLRLRVVLKEL